MSVELKYPVIEKYDSFSIRNGIFIQIKSEKIWQKMWLLSRFEKSEKFQKFDTQHSEWCVYNAYTCCAFESMMPNDIVLCRASKEKWTRKRNNSSKYCITKVKGELSGG